MDLTAARDAYYVAHYGATTQRRTLLAQAGSDYALRWTQINSRYSTATAAAESAYRQATADIEQEGRAAWAEESWGYRVSESTGYAEAMQALAINNGSPWAQLAADQAAAQAQFIAAQAEAELDKLSAENQADDGADGGGGGIDLDDVGGSLDPVYNDDLTVCQNNSVLAGAQAQTVQAASQNAVDSAQQASGAYRPELPDWSFGGSWLASPVTVIDDLSHYGPRGGDGAVALAVGRMFQNIAPRTPDINGFWSVNCTPMYSSGLQWTGNYLWATYGYSSYVGNHLGEGLLLSAPPVLPSPGLALTPNAAPLAASASVISQTASSTAPSAADVALLSWTDYQALAANGLDPASASFLADEARHLTALAAVSPEIARQAAVSALRDDLYSGETLTLTPDPTTGGFTLQKSATAISPAQMAADAHSAITPAAADVVHAAQAAQQAPAQGAHGNGGESASASPPDSNSSSSEGGYLSYVWQDDHIRYFRTEDGKILLFYVNAGWFYNDSLVFIGYIDPSDIGVVRRGDYTIPLAIVQNQVSQVSTTDDWAGWFRRNHEDMTVSSYANLSAAAGYGDYRNSFPEAAELSKEWAKEYLMATATIGFLPVSSARIASSRSPSLYNDYLPGLQNEKRLYPGAPANVAAAEEAASSASLRLQYMGRTPGKLSRTALEVQARAQAEGNLVRVGDTTMVRYYDPASSRYCWTDIANTDMAHRVDAVSWWNSVGVKYGPKAPEVRSFMLDPKNYELQPYWINRSKGALLTERYQQF